MKVLLSVSDPPQAARIAALFAGAGHSVALAKGGGDTLACWAREPVDLLVLDDAALLDRLRLSRPDAPILLITAPGDVDARVLGLERGADDALPSDFAHSQLMARAGALTRRAARAPRAPEVLSADGCELDLSSHVARRGPNRVQLTAREVGLLRWLATHRDRAVSRAELLEHVWGLSPKMETRTVDVAVAALRKKIERDPKEPRIVVSYRGAGYRFAP